MSPFTFPRPKIDVRPENLHAAVVKLGPGTHDSVAQIPTSLASHVIERLQSRDWERPGGRRWSSREITAAIELATEDQHSHLTPAVHDLLTSGQDIRVKHAYRAIARWPENRHLVRNVVTALDPLVVARSAAWLQAVSERLTDHTETAEAVAAAGQQSGTALLRTSAELQCPPGSPLARMVDSRRILGAPGREIRNHYDSLLETVGDQELHPEIRIAALSRTFEIYAAAISDPSEFSRRHLAVEWLLTARSALGGWPLDAPGRWAELPDRASEIARWFVTLRSIDEFFARAAGNQDRIRFWKSKARSISRFQEFRSARAFAMWIGRLVYVEFLETGNACYVYTPSEMQRLAARVVTRSDDLKDRVKTHNDRWWLTHQGLEWHVKFNEHLRRYS